MRTTLNLDDDVLELVRALAKQQGQPVGAIISSLVRRSLALAQPPMTRNGIRLFPVREDAGSATPETARALLGEAEEKVPEDRATIQDQILGDLDRLTPEQHRKAAELIRGLVSHLPRGTSGQDLLRFAGVLDEQSAREMAAAIEEDCAHPGGTRE